jgi:hypothetical protein
MFKTLSKAAAQEIAFKTVIDQLKGEMARCQQQQKHTTSLAIDSKVAEAHATFESILTGWGPSAGGLERILELELEEGEWEGMDNKHAFRPGSAMGEEKELSAMTPPKAGPGGHAVRTLELQRQVKMLTYADIC